MNQYPAGKGYLIWELRRCAGGDPNKLADMAKAAGLSWVAFKTHNDIFARNGDIAPHVKALEDVGIESWGWGYCYGNDPVGEAKIAASQTERFKLRGYLIDAEKEYKADGMQAKAAVFMTVLVDRMMGKPIGLCSYRYPSLHTTLPWSTFLKGCDFHAPQVYWLGTIGPKEPAWQLAKSIKELRAYKAIPVVPIGVASPNDAGTWLPTVEQIDNFNQATRDLNCPGIGWWSWQHAERFAPFWEAISNHDWNDYTSTEQIMKSVAEIESELESE